MAYWHLKKPSYGCCPTGALNSPDMIDVLLVSKKIKYGCFPTGALKSPIWLMFYWHLKKPRYGCCLTSTLKSPDMVDVLLASKISRHGCCPARIFIKHDSCPGKYLVIPIQCAKKRQGLQELIRILVTKWHAL